MTPDVVTIGEAMLRLSVQPGNQLERTETLNVHVAGAEANASVALAKLGREVVWLSRLPDSPLGRRVERDLQAAGVDLSQVRWVPEGRMGIYFVELSSSPRPVGVVYDRAGSAAAGMSIQDFDLETIASAKLLYLSGITTALSASCRELVFAAADRARSAGARLVVDVNYRAKLWTAEEARDCLEKLTGGADLVVVTHEDARDVFALEDQPEQAAARLRNRLEVGTVVLTLGKEGSIWVSADVSGRVDGIPTVIIDRLGAGDAFVAGVIDGLLDGDLERGLRTGTVLASLALGTHGDQVTTTRAEVERLLAGSVRSVDR